MAKIVKKSLSSIQITGAHANKSNLVNEPLKSKTSKGFPVMVSEASEWNNGGTPVRRNLAGTILRTDRFKNIEDGITPFQNTNTIYETGIGGVTVRDSVILCQKAYWNVALFRNIIDLMTEFSINDILYKGGSKQSRTFFEALFQKIGIWDLQDKFFREYFRSGNVFLYRFDADVKANDVRRIIQSLAAIKKGIPLGNPIADQNQPLKLKGAKGVPPNDQGDNHMGYPTGYPKSKDSADNNPLLQEGDVKLEIEPMKMPARYIILNPADINMLGTANFSYGIYYKMLTEYEVSRLRNLQTEEDIEVYNSLPKFTQDQIRAGVRSVYIPLDTKKVKIIFYKKQDYEPFAVPMGYPVLEDINAKIEMRRIDMAICRTMQQMVLLVTAGAKPEEGGINQKNLEVLQNIFKNPSVGRVLVADYTTKAEFVVPSIAELLDPKKYEVIDRDINIGLNNIFLGGEKFANQQKRVEVFMERLKQAKKAFLENFLIPEIKRIAASLKFKNYPTPYYDEGALRDDTIYAKIYSHLLDIGVLSPEQGIDAIRDNRLPETDELEPAQEDYKKLRDKGYYVPLIGGPKPGNGGSTGGSIIPVGRPSGTTGSPKSTNKISPMGANGSEEKPMEFSLASLKNNMILAQEVENDISSLLKKKHKVKKLNEKQVDIVNDIQSIIMTNEEPKDWVKSVKSYCESPLDKNQHRVNRVLGVAAEHQLGNYMAALLYSSRKENPSTKED